jgi:hypothetical protein
VALTLVCGDDLAAFEGADSNRDGIREEEAQPLLFVGSERIQQSITLGQVPQDADVEPGGDARTGVEFEMTRGPVAAQERELARPDAG